MKKTNSIHTIAKDLGVSATTISFIINGKARKNGISDQVIKRVERPFMDINYKPDTGKSKLIGMLVEDISDFFSAIAGGVEMGFVNSGYKMLFMSTKNDYTRTTSILDLLKEHKVDAFIIAPSPGLEKEVKELLSLGKPLIFLKEFKQFAVKGNVVDWLSP